MAELFNRVITGGNNIPSLSVASIIGVAGQVGSIIFNNKTVLGGIELPCTLEENYTDKVDITEHPTEEGVIISDHAVIMPKEITIHFGFSSSFSLASAIENVKNLIGLSEYDYLQGCYKNLLDMLERRETIKIVTALRTYENMIITDLSVSRSKDTESILDVTATCKEVLIAHIDKVTVPVTALKMPETTSQTQETGSKQAIGVSNQTAMRKAFGKDFTAMKNQFADFMVSFFN